MIRTFVAGHNRAVGMLVVCLALQASGSGGLPARGQQSGSEIENVIVATVDGRPIRAREVQRQLAETIGDAPVEAALLAELREQALRQLIDRQLVLQYLAANRLGASQQEIDLALRRIEKELAAQDTTLADFLRRSGLSADEFRRVVAWQTAWPNYIERHLTEENFARFFQQHQRDFDGTQVRVAHLLIKLDQPDDAAAQRRALDRAHAIREQIVEGQRTFAAAAESHSQAPTAADGGDIGWISRREPMPETFSRAAFSLQPGEVSEPVLTHFGVHLIHCLELKPGEKTWQEVRGELRPAIARFLFSWTANRQRGSSKIEVADDWQAAFTPTE